METQSQNKSRQQHKKNFQDVDFIYGKVPPNAKDAEIAILGALLLDKSAFDIVSERGLKPESFYVPAHGIVYSTIVEMNRKLIPVDSITLFHELIKSGSIDLIGGPYYITELTKDIVSSAHVEEHTKIVLQKAIQRDLIKIGAQLVNDSYNDGIDVFDLLNNAEKSISSVSSSTSKTSYSQIGDSVKEVVARTKILMEKPTKDGLIGVPSSIKTLDQCTAGWRKSDLIILAARPSVGKSGTAANLALNAASSEIKPTSVGIFSLEMSKEQWCERFLSAESRIDSWKLSRGLLSKEELTTIEFTANNKLIDAKIFIDDTAGIDLFELRSKARRMVNKDNVGLIIIDYLQLMSGNKARNENREQEISSISRGLKGLAKELQIPIIALSQLSRGVEGKKGGIPQLSDLRESGAIEQDADIVIFLMNPDDASIKENADLKDSILLKIAKHRNGPLDTISIKYVKSIQKIMSNEEYDRWKFLQKNPGYVAMPSEQPFNLVDDDLPF